MHHTRTGLAELDSTTLQRRTVSYRGRTWHGAEHDYGKRLNVHIVSSSRIHGGVLLSKFLRSQDYLAFVGPTLSYL